MNKNNLLKHIYLAELHTGRLHEMIYTDGDCQKLKEEIGELYEAAKEKLSPDQWKSVVEYEDAMSEVHCLEEELVFKYALSLGMALATEAYSFVTTEKCPSDIIKTQ